MTLNGRTLFITGASRGIGKAIALRAAADGANVVITGKTVEPHPVLPGTIHTAAEDVVQAGGHALAVPMDVRDEAQVAAAIDRAVDRFGGIDIVVNNASAISLTGTRQTPVKRFDLMHQVNTRGTFITSQLALPHLERSAAAHILNLAPPLRSTLDAKWFAPHLAYTLAKYGMSLAVLGMAEELRPAGIAVNALWPRTAIDTEAIRLIAGADARHRTRSPRIMADAAHWILTRPGLVTGRFYLDEEALAEAGVTDLTPYNPPGVADTELMADFFV